MSKEIKSGRDVIEKFFAEIMSIKGVDSLTVEKLVELYGENRLTDSNIQNALEELKQAKLNSEKKPEND